jgi:subtilisin family serine protease
MPNLRDSFAGVWRALRRIAILGLLAGSLAGSLIPAAPAAGQVQAAGNRSAALQPGEKALAYPALDSVLNALVAAWGQDSQAARQQYEIQGVQFEGERILVSLTFTDAIHAKAALQALPAFQGSLKAHYDRWLDALLPVERLPQAAALPGISLVSRPAPLVELAGESPQATPAPAPGTHISEGVGVSNADEWHAAGLTGAGVKVGIIDSFARYQEVQAAGELPAQITISGTIDTNSAHGTNVAEVLYDMAPGVALTFSSTSAQTCASMAQTILGLAASGNRVISSSVGVLQCGAGDGNPANDPIAGAVQQARAAYGAQYFQAAGNQALRHWDGIYTGGTWHEFSPGVTVNILGDLQAGALVYMSMRWNDWPASDQDYDLYLLRRSGSDWVTVTTSQNRQSGSQPPTELIFTATPSAGTYGFAVYRYDAQGGHVIDVINRNFTLQFDQAARSLVGPATSQEVAAIGAVDVLSLQLEPYSSRGPTYGPGGVLSGGSIQPSLVGYANVDTYTNWTGSRSTFGGTSAATPHVAGAAALVWAANPCLSPQQVVDFLKSRAIDQGAPGVDPVYGAGLLYLGAPADDLCSNPPTPTPTGSPSPSPTPRPTRTPPPPGTFPVYLPYTIR